MVSIREPTLWLGPCHGFDTPTPNPPDIMNHSGEEAWFLGSLGLKALDPEKYIRSGKQRGDRIVSGC